MTSMAWSQIHRQFRKPLVVAAPKNLLRHPQAKSPLAEFDEVADDKGIVGVRFKRVIMDQAETDRCVSSVAGWSCFCYLASASLRECICHVFLQVPSFVGSTARPQS